MPTEDEGARIAIARDVGTRRSALAVAAVLAAVATPARAEPDPLFEEHALCAVPRGIEVESGIEFAPDGTHVAYVGKRDGKSLPVIDAKPSDPYWWVSRPRFGADGHVAFRVIKPPEKKVHVSWVLLDGKKMPQTDGVNSFEWSPDGRRLAYVAYPECRIADDQSRTGDCMLFVDGKMGSKRLGVWPPVWSPDSKHVLALAETKGGKGRTVTHCVLLDDKPIAEGDLPFDGPVFSGDGTRVAYAAQSAPAAKAADIKWVVACGDLRLGKEFDAAASPVFTPDGKRIAFKAQTAGRVGVSVDGAAAQGDWSFVTTPVFSADGAHMAYTASNDCTVEPGYGVVRMGEGIVKGGSWQPVLDGAPSAEKFDAVKDLTFSPDGKRLAFRARSGPRWRIVCGARKSAEFDFAGPPQFSPDGTRVAFGVLSGRDFAWKVLAVE